jgi:hypothetical protein
MFGDSIIQGHKMRIGSLESVKNTIVVGDVYQQISPNIGFKHKVSFLVGRDIPSSLGWWDYYMYGGFEEWQVFVVTPLLLSFRSSMCVYIPYPYV